MVFLINVTPDDIPDCGNMGNTSEGQNPDLSPVDPDNPDPENTSVTELDEASISSPPPEGHADQPEVVSLSRNHRGKLEETGNEETATSGGAAALAAAEDTMPKLHEVLVGAQDGMDYGTDALQNDMSASLYNLTLTRYVKLRHLLEANHS